MAEWMIIEIRTGRAVRYFTAHEPARRALRRMNSACALPEYQLLTVR